MKYLKSEHLKFRRTFFNKLLIIAPLITAVFAWLMAGFTGFQYMSLYWWYSFLLPGTITVLCYLSNQKEIRADKYYSVYSMSINLKKFWISKNLILIEKMIFAAFILALLVCVSNIISPSTVIFTPGQSFIGSVAIMIASIWQIPLGCCPSSKSIILSLRKPSVIFSLQKEPSLSGPLCSMAFIILSITVF